MIVPSPGNVVWDDDHTAARVISAISQPLPPPQTSEFVSVYFQYIICDSKVKALSVGSNILILILYVWVHGDN